MGAAGLCAFDWDKERLTLDDSAKYFLEEFDRIDRLKAQAEFAKSGKTPTNSNGNNQNNAKTIAPTADEEIQVNRDKKEMESWEFYVQRDNMITWRREEEEGHYSYKGENVLGMILSSSLMIILHFSVCLISRHHSRGLSICAKRHRVSQGMGRHSCRTEAH